MDPVPTLIAQSYRALDALLETTIIPGYTRIGYAVRRALLWDPADLAVDLTGRVMAITGGNSGLGYAAARQLAARGATVYLLVRNAARGAAAQASLVRTTGNPHVAVELIDLSSLASVRAGVQRLLARTSRLDVLINNAGAEFTSHQLSDDGIEMTFATNVVGPFLLTNLLIPRLQQSAPARVINVSTGGMYTQKLDVTDLQGEQRKFNNLVAYAQAKRALVMLTELWAARLAGTGVTVNAMHPGWADTPIVQAGLPRFRRVMGPLLRTPDQGADTIVWLAVAPRLAGVSGAFWMDRWPRALHKLRQTTSLPADYQRLWDECMRLAGHDRLALQAPGSKPKSAEAD
jgi:NAD(P)-dependent dehydrogenase (short-subunit alcohol dehydrogenase family)